jgi:hypothetical protein
MAHSGRIGDGHCGPVAECVNARTVHRSLSWFKSRPGLQPLRRSVASGQQGHFGAGGSTIRNGVKITAKCRLIGLLRPFRGCGIWSKDQSRARATWRTCSRDARHARPFFVPICYPSIIRSLSPAGRGVGVRGISGRCSALGPAPQALRRYFPERHDPSIGRRDIRNPPKPWFALRPRLPFRRVARRQFQQ